MIAPHSTIEALIDGCVHPVDVTQIDVDLGLPYVTHSGILKLGDIEITVHVLNTGQRIIEKEDFEALLSLMADWGEK
jgi:hypothetical protein